MSSKDHNSGWVLASVWLSFTCLLAPISSADIACPERSEYSADTAFENGKIIGYKISPRAYENSAKYFGFEKGDILMRIDGIAMNASEQMWEKWKQIRSGKTFTIQIKRGEKAYLISMLPDYEYIKQHMDCVCLCKAKKTIDCNKIFRNYSMKVIRP